MKKLSMLIALVFCLAVKAQTNLVPNGSFEIESTCPTYLDQMNKAMYWSSYNESPDYYNTCSAVNGMAPPNAMFGYQKPVNNGNAYAGFGTANYATTNYREIIGAALTSPLTVGVKYYFSFFVSRGNIQGFNMATNNIGLRFLNYSYTETNPIPIINFAHFNETELITDTANWVPLKGSFTADSAYKYIAFGNFFDDAHTDTMGFGNTYNEGSYYYIDNICVSTDSVLAYTNFIQIYHTNSGLSIYPNPVANILQVSSSYKQILELQITDMVGNTLMQGSIQKGRVCIDVSNLPAGIYFVKIDRGVEKFIKQ